MHTVYTVCEINLFEKKTPGLRDSPHRVSLPRAPWYTTGRQYINCLLLVLETRDRSQSVVLISITTFYQLRHRDSRLPFCFVFRSYRLPIPGRRQVSLTEFIVILPIIYRKIPGDYLKLCQNCILKQTFWNNYSWTIPVFLRHMFRVTEDIFNQTAQSK